MNLERPTMFENQTHLTKSSKKLLRLNVFRFLYKVHLKLKYGSQSNVFYIEIKPKSILSAVEY